MVDLYDIVNLVNGKRYVGITTKGWRRRWAQHCYVGRQGKGTRLYAAMRCYGTDLFRPRLLKQCASLDEAKAEEIRLIAIWAPEYNHSSGGESRAGCKMPRHVVERLAALRRGRPNHFRGKTHTSEARAKMSAASKGKQRRLGIKRPGSGLKGAATKRERGTTSRPWLGKKRDAATNAKISATKMGRPRPPLSDQVVEIFRENMRRAAKARRRPIICLNDDRVFESARDASAFYGLWKTAAAAVAGGRRNSVNGLRFRYLDAPDAIEQSV